MKVLKQSNDTVFYEGSQPAETLTCSGAVLRKGFQLVLLNFTWKRTILRRSSSSVFRVSEQSLAQSWPGCFCCPANPLAVLSVMLLLCPSPSWLLTLHKLTEVKYYSLQFCTHCVNWKQILGLEKWCFLFPVTLRWRKRSLCVTYPCIYDKCIFFISAHSWSPFIEYKVKF